MTIAAIRTSLASVLFGCVVAPFAAALSHAAQPGPEPEPENSRAALVRYLDAQAALLLETRRQALAAIVAPAQADARQAAVRARLVELIGQPVHGSALAARITGTSQGPGYRVENLLYDAQPGRHVTANLFLPATGSGPFPAVILAPGHAPAGKLGNYAFAANFARNGFVALSYDIVGEGERLEHLDPRTGRSLGERPTGEHSLAAYPAILNGEHVARYFVEDAMQGVDYLARRPDVDATRIGAFGCSGGGTITAYLAALDARVQATAVACYINDFSHLLAGIGPQDAEQSIPDFIAAGFDIADWAELAAPKPYAVVSTTGDMFPFAGAEAAVGELRHFWAAYGAPDRLTWITGPGPHGAIAPLGEQIIGFFRRALRADSPAAPFIALRPARDEDVQVTPSGQLASSIGSVTLADLARARTQAIAPALPLPLAALRAAVTARARLQPRTGLQSGLQTGLPSGSQTGPQPAAVRRPDVVRDGITFSTIELPSAMGPLEMRIAAATGATTGRVMLVLDTAPPQRLAQPGARLEQLARAGWTAIALQARASEAGNDAKHTLVGDQDLLALRAMLVGRTLPGIRIDDTLRAIDAIVTQFPSAPITLTGVGIVGPVALQAALLEARVQAVRIEQAPMSWRAAVASALARDLPANAMPGVLADYDLPDVIAALAPRRVDIIAPVDAMGAPLSMAALRRLVPPQPHVHDSADGDPAAATLPPASTRAIASGARPAF